MGLVQQQQYTPFVRPYVEGPVKEYKELQDRLIKDYDEAAIMYDSLKEAADNMVSLGAEGDVNAKKAAFQKAYKSIEEAARMGDYENRGRLVRKAIKDFSTDYKPIVEQVQARQKAFEDLDKSVESGKRTSVQVSALKQYYDTLYKDAGGLKKDESNNYLGYSSRIVNAPNNIDVIEKINKAMSGVVPYERIKEWESLVNAPGNEYDKMMALQKFSRKYIPEETIKTIFKQVWQDPEVQGFNNFWAGVDSYNASPEDANRVLNNKIASNAQRLRQQFKEKYAGLSDDEMMQVSEENLKVNGNDVDNLRAQIQDKATAKKYVAETMLMDKYNELADYTNKKYGQVQTMDGLTYSETQASRNAMDAATPATNVWKVTQPFLDTNGNVNSTSLEETKNKTANDLEYLYTTSLLEGSTPSEPALKAIREKYTPTAEEARAGITYQDKVFKNIEKMATTKNSKQQHYASILEKARGAYMDYQNARQTEIDAENHTKAVLGTDYTKSNELKESILKETTVKGNKKLLRAALEFPELIGTDMSINIDGEYNTVRLEGNSLVFTSVDDWGAPSYSVPLTNSQVQKLNTSKNIITKAKQAKRSYYESLRQVSSIPVYNTIGSTEQEARYNEGQLKEYTSPQSLNANANKWVATAIVNGKAVESTSVGTLMKNYGVEDISKVFTTGFFVKGNSIPTKNGKENGIAINFTAPNGTQGTIYIPQSQISNNALVNATNQVGQYERLVEDAKAKSASIINLGKITDTIIDKGKTIDIRNKNVTIKFPNPANRNDFELDIEE